MSRFPTLHRHLAAVVLATAGLAGCECPEPFEGTKLSALDSATFGAELDACLADDLACADLCYSVLAEQDVPFEREEMDLHTCRIVGEVDGKPIIDIVYHVPQDCGIGRRPARWADSKLRARDAIGAHLVAAAHLEAASVFAFAELARELRHHHAPPELVERCLAAADDERRHALVTASFARRYGGQPTFRLVALGAPRPLFEVARANMVEGCVRELAGAATALWQASYAADPEFRAAMSVIAREEAEHAELSLDIDAWVQALLGAEARAAIASARAAAIAELIEPRSIPQTAERAELERVLGLPGLEARALALRLFA